MIEKETGSEIRKVKFLSSNYICPLKIKQKIAVSLLEMFISSSLVRCLVCSLLRWFVRWFVR